MEEVSSRSNTRGIKVQAHNRTTKTVCPWAARMRLAWTIFHESVSLAFFLYVVGVLDGNYVFDPRAWPAPLRMTLTTVWGVLIILLAAIELRTSWRRKAVPDVEQDGEANPWP